MIVLVVLYTYGPAALIGFMIGSLPTGYWIGKLSHGIDVRNYGSRNLGATNVFRVLGWKAGLATLLIDTAKGFLAVSIGRHLTYTVWNMQQIAGLPEPPVDNAILWTCGLASILGHSFSPWVKFRGGKGVATAAGILLALLPTEASISLGIFAIVFAFSRIVSLSSIMSAIALPIATAYFAHDIQNTFITAVLALFIIWRHRSNIVRLLNGTEKPLQSNAQN